MRVSLFISFSRRHLKLEKLRRETVSEDACSLCFDRPGRAVLRPCGHGGMCGRCAAQLGGQCPICRGPIEAIEEEQEDDDDDDHDA